ncbi:glycosyltransferase family 87 protein [Thermoflexus sp.]|uniref:glycosyltransferase family 87 protein n=1 Tax=Thermoflexus sp. TaxID=1969742 RepID=UPI002ADE1FC0|nr:glycosyltransferase family 87 protein [Thermoflexus sp.]
MPSLRFAQTALRLYRALRWPALAATGAFLYAWSYQNFQNPFFLHHDDFTAYWSAARLLLERSDPYSPEQLLAMEQAAGRPWDEPLRLWNPPWTPAWLLPMAALPYPAARTLWFLIQVIAVGWGAARIWWLYGGSRFPLLAWLIAFTSVPALTAFRYGQSAPLLLLGAVGFLHFHQRGARWLAGLSLSLATIKPQATLVLLVAAGLYSLRHRDWRLMLGLLLPPGIGLLVAWILYPPVLGSYLHQMRDGPLETATFTLGAWLRYGVGIYHPALLFLPSALAVTGLLIRFRLNRAFPNWREHFPELLWLSSATMAYGWVYDYILALAAWIPMALRLKEGCPQLRWIFYGGLALTQFLMAHSVEQFRYAWIGVLWWAGHTLAWPRCKPSGWR